MLGALAFEPVRQEHHEPAQAVPFVFGADDELIDDALGDVPEVPELGFPHHESFGAIEAVAVFESKHCGFRQGAIDDFDSGLVCSKLS